MRVIHLSLNHAFLRTIMHPEWLTNDTTWMQWEQVQREASREQEEWQRQQQRHQQQGRTYEQYTQQQQQRKTKYKQAKNNDFKWDFDVNDPWSVLGVPRGSSKEDVPKAFRRASLFLFIAPFRCRHTCSSMRTSHDIVPTRPRCFSGNAQAPSQPTIAGFRKREEEGHREVEAHIGRVPKN